MTLRIAGKHMDVGDALRARITERVGDIVGKYFDRGFSGQVTIIKSGSRFTCDCVLRLDSGASLHATGESHEPVQAFEVAAERLDTRMRRYTRRLKSHYPVNASSDGASITYAVVEAPIDDDEEDIPADFAPTIVAESTLALKTMSVASAVIELDTLGSPVLVFRNGGTEQLNIVYRRPDGNIGWIDPATVKTARG